MKKHEELVHLAKEKAYLLKAMQMMLALGSPQEELCQMQAMVDKINKEIVVIKDSMNLE